MKVLSNRTAQRLIAHLDEADRTPHSERSRRGAPTTTPDRMWRIHVNTASGEVAVDGGTVYTAGAVYNLVDIVDLGTAATTSFVVWKDGENGGAIELIAEADWKVPTDLSFRVLGKVVLTEIEVEAENGNKNIRKVFTCEQYIAEPIEASASGASASAVILKVISRSGIGYLAAPNTNNEDIVDMGELCLPTLNVVNDLPAGTPIIAFPTTTETVGGWTE